MASDSITFNNVTINQALGSTKLNGTLNINYDTLAVTGTLTDGAGTKFSNFAITTADNGLTYTLQGGGGLLATVTVKYAGQTPTTTTVTYTSVGLLSGTTNNVPVTAAVLPCFAAGTKIRTNRGSVAVEDLAIGDLAVTSSGEQRPIRWLGHRTIDCRSHPNPQEIMPIRISADAFGPARPSRDLFVSPGHAICVDVAGEMLIPASVLANGSTIQQIEVDEITYWHVEFDDHDILLAENLPAESYLDMGNRGYFLEADIVDLVADPDIDVAARSHADFCRPYQADGVVVQAVREKLAAQAMSLGWTLDGDDPFAGLHLVVDGTRMEPLTRGHSARFAVPAGVKEVWLVCEPTRPCDVLNSIDSRSLGVCVARLTIDDGFAPHGIAIDDPRLSIGFHDTEQGSYRWTTGRSRLPAEIWPGCDVFLRVDLAWPALRRWKAPAAARGGKAGVLAA